MSKEKARYARYRKRRRERIGEEADKARAAKATRESHARHRTEQNEKRRASDSRKTQLAAKLSGKGPVDKRTSGITIVGSNAIRYDLTRWRGNGMYREIALEKQADLILRKAGYKP